MPRLQIKPAVYIVVKQNSKYLFIRRFNTGFCDGCFTFPSGHVDENELPIKASVRELKEEVDITIKSSDLELVHVLFEKDNYVDFYFIFNSKNIKPKLNEPNKSDKLLWVSPDDIDKIKFVPKVKVAFQHIKRSDKRCHGGGGPEGCFRLL